MEVSFSSEEEVFVEETSSEKSSVEKVSSTNHEARLAELKKQLMNAPGNSWAEALKKAGPKAGTPGTPACLPKESLKPFTKRQSRRQILQFKAFEKRHTLPLQKGCN